MEILILWYCCCVL